MLRALGWSMLISLIAYTGFLTRVAVANRRLIRELQTDLREAREVEAVLKRASGKKPRHLRLLALVPPAAWVASHVARRHVAVAAVAAAGAFTAGTVDLHDGPTHPHMRPPAAEASERPAVTATALPRAEYAPRPPAVPATTGTTVATAHLPPVEATPTTRPAPAPTTTTTATVGPLAAVSTTVVGEGCLVDAELLGLDVELCAP